MSHRPDWPTLGKALQWLALRQAQDERAKGERPLKLQRYLYGALGAAFGELEGPLDVVYLQAVGHERSHVYLTGGDEVSGEGKVPGIPTAGVGDGGLLGPEEAAE